MSAIIVGKPNGDTRGRIEFSAEIVTCISPNKTLSQVVFDSLQFFLISPPLLGMFDIYIVQKGVISDFNNFFSNGQKLKEQSDKNYYFELLTKCSSTLFSEKEKEQSERTYTKKIREALPFVTTQKPWEKYKFISEDDTSVHIGIGTDKRLSAHIYSEPFESQPITPQKGTSLIHFQISQSTKFKYYMIGVNYKVKHSYEKRLFDERCHNNTGFLNIYGYSPQNIFNELNDNVDRADLKYFTGDMQDKFDKISMMIDDKEASGNITTFNKTNHFIVIDATQDLLFFQPSSGSHHIPIGPTAKSKSVHVIAPGLSENYTFTMLLYHIDDTCPIIRLTPEQASALPDLIDNYIKGSLNNLKKS